MDDDLFVDGDELLGILARWEAVAPDTEDAGEGMLAFMGDDDADVAIPGVGADVGAAPVCEVEADDSDSVSDASSSTSSYSSSSSSSTSSTTSMDSELRKKKCDDILKFAGGELRYYNKGQRVVAHCPCHMNCVRTRGFQGSTSKARAGQGRPLGFLARWMELGHVCSVEEHNTLQPDGVPFEQRLDARNELMETAGSVRFLNRERPLREGEGLEPETIR